MILLNLLPVERRYVPLVLEHAELADAQDFVRRLHRHSVPVVSHRFSLAARELGGGIRGVAICGRPTARGLDMRTTVEVLRVATDGVRNGCSFLYGASCLAARTRLLPGRHLHAGDGARDEPRRCGLRARGRGGRRA